MATAPAPLVRRLTTAASDLLGSLNHEQRSAAVFDFGDIAARRDWHYVPREHPGLTLVRMDADQRKAVHQLLAATLSPPVYAQAATILALEDVLDEREGGRRARRPTDAAITIFGEPGREAPWSWRLEGHHIAVNATVVDGALTATPLFLGANPARVQHAGVDVVRPLAPEEDIARALLNALNPGQREAAMVAADAPGDILTTNAVEVTPSAVPRGVDAGDLEGEAAALLTRLLSVYAGRVAAADPSLGDPTGVHFAWAGSASPGRPHYYRLEGPHLFVEYDNTQNDANHVHSVWRRPDDDFGRGLLARHRAAERATAP
ncbi:MAG: DUF3500 domain-containing protein [Euzebyaceae bacterium]|jgi:hypothetical protein|nr:DUF3500 domain-containing protein [Euzebyaceae bacterium]